MLLAGCAGREAYVPQPLGDDGGGLADGELCSDPSASVPASLHIENAGLVPIRILWSDTNCQEIEYRVLQGGEAYDQGTYIGHAWRARRMGDNELLIEVKVETTSDTLRVEP